MQYSIFHPYDSLHSLTGIPTLSWDAEFEAYCLGAPEMVAADCERSIAAAGYYATHEAHLALLRAATRLTDVPLDYWSARYDRALRAWDDALVVFYHAALAHPEWLSRKPLGGSAGGSPISDEQYFDLLDACGLEPRADAPSERLGPSTQLRAALMEDARRGNVARVPRV